MRMSATDQFLYDEPFSQVKGLETNSYSPIVLFLNMTRIIQEPMIDVENGYCIPLLTL